jgi:hypothetical protein
MISSVNINDYEIQPEEWLIDGLVCPWLTVLSGQPKFGKSLLAGHIAISLINNKPILNKQVFGDHHSIAWMGYDPGWKEEIITRWKNEADGRIELINPIRTLEASNWDALVSTLRQKKITLFIVDHIYGMAGAMGLNDADNVAVLTNLLRPIYEDAGIPVLLLSQASKSEFGRGRAAHSIAIEGEARALIRIHEKRAAGARKIDLISNLRGEENLSVRLTPEVIELKELKTKSELKKTDRESPDSVRKFLQLANKEDLTTWTGVGRELSRLGFSTNPVAGRTMSTRWRNQGLLKEESGQIVAGDSLLDIPVSIDSYINKNAS